MPGGGKGSNWGRILHGWRRRGGPLIPDEFSGGTLTIRTWSLGWGQLSSSQNGKGKKFGGELALLGIFVETRNFVSTAALLVSHESRFAPFSRPIATNFPDPTRGPPTKPMTLNSLCVYCGSSPGKNPEFMEAAHDFGATLAGQGITTIYGGGDVGLMGAVAKGALQAGGRVIGVIPQDLMDEELGNPGLTELHVVDSMHERKTKMAELSDAFVALPGGIGTMEELFEVFTWTQLSIHLKPCALLNLAGFYDLLAQFLRQMVEQHFLKPESLESLLVDDDPENLLERLASWEHRPVFN
jgi:uncharacterized protein (TIGR00730 family)